MKFATLERLLRDRSEKSSVVLATNLNTGDERLVYPSDLEGENGLDPAVAQAAGEAFRSDRSKTIETEEGPVFLHVFNPPLRMIIVGAVHIAQPLARMAALAGYDVTIVDPRAAFATDERFPGVTLLTEWPDDALETLAPDSRTAVVTLTHDPKLDDPALEVALRSSAFYVGSLGSKKTHAARLQRLTETGFGEDDLNRINGPVGLAIGARSPAEVAVSIVAQVTQTLRQEA
ncbi:MAG: XdhC family protein [Alphaproteobacteria bacterium]|nr:XdhC family protein [Alphaproteobacteria bacterium]MCY4499894.1 XdhC family protein [Rhodospirillaceae bacterium]